MAAHKFTIIGCILFEKNPMSITLLLDLKSDFKHQIVSVRMEKYNPVFKYDNAPNCN